MKLADVVRNADKIVIDSLFVSQVEEVYSCKLPEFVKHILCIADYARFDEPEILHKLAKDMILEATEEMSSDLIGNNVLPIFDCSDNNFLCYDYSNQLWCMYNIVDDIAYNKQGDILDLL